MMFGRGILGFVEEFGGLGFYVVWWKEFMFGDGERGWVA